MQRTKTEKWPSEAAMMACFQAEAKAWGFRVYPESGGFDLLIQATAETCERMAAARRDANNPMLRFKEKVVRDAHHAFNALRDLLEVDDVIAIEGKLRGSFEVLQQAMPRGRRAMEWITESSQAADWYAVVVPEAPPGFDAVAHACGVIVMTCLPERDDPIRKGWGDAEKWRLPAGVTSIGASQELRVTGYNRIQVPRIEVDMAGGQPAPRAVTPWKIGAVELCLLAQHRPLTRADFRARTVSPESLVRHGWAVCSGRGPTATWTLTGAGAEHIRPRADGVSVWGPRRPDIEYPEIVEALLRSGFDPGAPTATTATTPAELGPLFVAEGGRG